MLVAAFLKAILFYFAFLAIRGIYRSYKTVKAFQSTMNGQGQGQAPFGREGGFYNAGNPFEGKQSKTQSNQSQSTGKNKGADIIEAEFRHLNDE